MFFVWIVRAIAVRRTAAKLAARAVGVMLVLFGWANGAITETATAAIDAFAHVLPPDQNSRSGNAMQLLRATQSRLEIN